MICSVHTPALADAASFPARLHCRVHSRCLPVEAGRCYSLQGEQWEIDEEEGAERLLVTYGVETDDVNPVTQVKPCPHTGR